MISLFVIILFCMQLSECALSSINSSFHSSFTHHGKNSDMIPYNFDYYQSDGFFNGYWKTSQDQGVLNGTLSFGRSDTTGIINGLIKSNDTNVEYQLSARIFQQFIIGRLTAEYDFETMSIIGSINADMPSFTFTVFNSRVGLVQGHGIYDGSLLPMPTYSFHVGKRSYHLIDESREEWFTENNTSDYRELMIQVWYPSLQVDVNKRTDYMDEITFSWLRDQGPVPLVTIPADAYTFVHPYVYKDVEPVERMSFPVLLFSPGYDGVDAIYTSFIDELVSSGYIVVSMNHPYVSGVTVFPDGRAKYIADLPGDISAYHEFLLRSQQTVIDDALFVLDAIEELNQTDSLLSGIFDCSRVGMFGHSFGGAATMSCCFEDERIQAGFTLDGVVYDELLTGPIHTAFCLMCAEQRFNHSSYDHVWNQFAHDAYQIGVRGSSHFSYTDVGMLLSHFLPFVPGSLLGFGTVEPTYLISVTRRFEKAFFDVYLKNVEKQVLFDLFDDFDDVLIREK